MVYDVRVAIIDPDQNSRKKLKEQLNAVGYLVVTEAVDGRSGLLNISQTQPDVIMIAATLPTENIKMIEEQRMAPLLIITQDPVFPEHLNTVLIFGFVTLVMNDTMLESAVRIAINNFKRLCQLEQEVKDLKLAIEERKIIEQAKGLLMEKRGYSERKAFQYMRKLAMDKCVPLGKVAKAVIKLLHHHAL